MNLYSINYIHHGAPKTWYAIPTDYGKRFETLVEGITPASFRACPQYLRHKSTLVSPTIVKNSGIPIYKVTQEVGEFIITFPFAYHQGFNHGFNIAEATNFASRHWIDYGLDCKHCTCHEDGVRIDMRPFVKQYQPERWAEWMEKEAEEETSSCESSDLEEEEEKRAAKPKSKGKKVHSDEDKKEFKREIEYNITAATGSKDKEHCNSLTCAICFESGPVAAGGERIIKMMRDVVSARKLPSVSSSDDDSSEEQEFECESGCGFESTCKKAVVAHEKVCIRLAGIKGKANKNNEERLNALKEVITCVSCAVTVHRGCYDLDAGTSGWGWKCGRCKSGERLVKCELCPQKGGAFKETSDGRYVHVQCGLACPDLDIHKAGALERLEHPLKSIQAQRKALSCTTCKRKRGKDAEACKRTGSCVQCSHPDCVTAFHVTCAQRDPSLYCQRIPSEGKGPKSDNRWDFFCSKHQTAAAPKPLELVPVGEDIWARCRGRCYYQGVVREVWDQTLCDVLFQDGSSEKGVLKSELMRKGKSKGAVCETVKPETKELKELVSRHKFDRVMRQPDGDLFLCAILSEEIKVSYVVELYNGETKTLSKASVLTMDQADEKRGVPRKQGKGSPQQVSTPIQFYSKDDQAGFLNPPTNPPVKRLLDVGLGTKEETVSTKRVRVSHNYAALNKGARAPSKAFIST